jgi:hypothetical protein
VVSRALATAKVLQECKRAANPTKSWSAIADTRSWRMGVVVNSTSSVPPPVGRPARVRFGNVEELWNAFILHRAPPLRLIDRLNSGNRRDCRAASQPIYQKAQLGEVSAYLADGPRSELAALAIYSRLFLPCFGLRACGVQPWLISLCGFAEPLPTGLGDA